MNEKIMKRFLEATIATNPSLAADIIEKLKKENMLLKKALKVYAHKDNWEYYDGHHPTWPMFRVDGKTHDEQEPTDEESKQIDKGEIGPWTHAEHALSLSSSKG